MKQAMAPTEDSHRKDSGRPAAPDLDAVAAAFPHLEVIELIGAGGMGAVFRARQPQLGRLVALKVIPATGRGASPAFADRFEREGRLLARLHHPNIVTIYDSGRAGDFFYLLMEHVDGVNLRQALRAGRFSPRDALTIVPRICEALQYAHDEGVLHRDVKPENILLDSRGRVKLADFGIGKWATGDGDGLAHEESTEPLAPTLTQAGVALGTPRYMAPEQAVDPQSVDHRADIYSLGVVFYELLTGELPPGEVVRPSDRAAVDGRIDAIVRQALQRERELRQRSAEEMKTQIESVGSTAPVAPRRKWRRLLSGLCFILAALIAVHFLIWIGLSLSAIALNLMPVEWAGLPVPWFIGLALFGLALGAVGWLLSADQGMAETPHDRIANPAARTKSLRNYFFGVFLTMMATAFVWFCVQMVIWWTQGSMEVASGAAWILFVFLAIAALGLTATGTIQMQVAQWSTPRRWAMTALGLTSAVLLVGVVWWIPRPYKSSKLAAAMESEARRQNDIARAAQSAARSAAVAAARARYDDVRQRYELGTVDQLELGRARHDLEVAEAGDDPLKRAEATASWAQEKENLIRQRFEAGMVTQSEVEQAAQDRIAANAALFEQRAASRTREAGVNEATVSLIQWIQGTWAADFQRSQREARIADHVQSDDERRRAQAMLEGFRATAQSGADGMTWTITETEIASHHPKTGDRRGPYSVVGATGNDSLEIESLDEGMIHRMLLVRDGDHLRLDRLDLPADPSPLHVPAYFVRVTSTQDKDP